ncbi:hypothetical protein VV089_06920 [Candidatus Merdisoma sp. JLR.KK011]|jgi:hypothetical protein|uniref:hypothetical protein n=1 Tax=Candidatus Merdisoma sp. JLR.KK011 TaxID=3114299 RepID=UPI001558F4A6
MDKVASSVSIIGGADGPTSIFIAGKGGKVKLRTRIQNYFLKIRRNRIKKADYHQSPYTGGGCGIAETGAWCCGGFAAVS